MERNCMVVPGPQFLLYGANGYTGRLILERALQQGLRPVIAGRDGGAIRELAARHGGLEHYVFGLGDEGALSAAVRRVPVVLHAAGPFIHTATPMVEACLRHGTHYIDVTGELEVFERLHALDGLARVCRVLLLPGAGFDVVPTDLLAAHLSRRLPGALHLRLAFQALRGGVSRGTARTAVEHLGQGGAVRRGGRIVRVPAAWRTRTVDFGFGTTPASVTTIPWGDVSTAFYSTRIPNIEVYTRLHARQRRLLKATRPFGVLLGSAPVRRLLRAAVQRGPEGPGEEQRRRGTSLVWGAVETAGGRRAEARMRLPEGYTLTAMTAVEAVRRVLAGDAPAGFRTPSLAWGPDWILALDGVEREDVV
jgi:short subunit dehydrogenase-like uncharacterized protein